jgi:signal transduction histidine kinase
MTSSEGERLRRAVRARAGADPPQADRGRAAPRPRALLRSELDASEARVHASSLKPPRWPRAHASTQLARANRELEAFSYSVSHDLRAPLRTISAFTHVLAEDLGDKLAGRSVDHMRRVLAATSRMSDLIDALLELARISRAPIVRHRVELSSLAAIVIDELRRRDPERHVDVSIEPDLVVAGDGRLMRILLDNLLGNAWKFTSPRATPLSGELDGEPASRSDDGAGLTCSRGPVRPSPTTPRYSGRGIDWRRPAYRGASWQWIWAEGQWAGCETHLHDPGRVITAFCDIVIGGR